MSFIKNSIIYIFFSALGRSGAFLLLPILTSNLSKEDFGWLAMFSNTMILLTPIISLNGNILIAKSFHSASEPNLLKDLEVNALIIALLVLVIMFPVFFFSLEYYVLIVLATCAALAGAFNSFYLMKYQLQQLPTKFGMIQMASMVGNTCLTLAFIQFDFLSYETRCLAIIAGLLLPFYKELYQAICRLKRSAFDSVLVAKGFKLVPLSLLNWTLAFSDKILIGQIHSLSEAGAYFVIYTLCIPLSLIYLGIGRVVQPHVYKHKMNLAKQMRYLILFSICTFLVFLLFTLAAPFVGKIILDEKLFSSFNYILPICLYIFLSSVAGITQGIQISRNKDAVATGVMFTGVIVFLIGIVLFGRQNSLYIPYIVSASYLMIIIVNLTHLLISTKKETLSESAD